MKALPRLVDFLSMFGIITTLWLAGECWNRGDLAGTRQSLFASVMVTCLWAGWRWVDREIFGWMDEPGDHGGGKSA